MTIKVESYNLIKNIAPLSEIVKEVLAVKKVDFAQAKCSKMKR